MSEQTFIAKALSGEIVEPDEEIDDFIDVWHETPNQAMALHDFLGMSWEEYALWAEKPAFLRAILMARRHGSRLDLIVRNAEPTLALAARGVPPEELSLVRAWLEETGRLG
jgi:hypothetical protein